MRRFLSLFTVLMLSGVLAFAQNRVVTGKVTDASGAPIPFATVTETGVRNVVVADANGNYSIKLRGTGGITVSPGGLSYSPTVYTALSEVQVQRTTRTDAGRYAN